ncbi:MAG: immune inhibitor A [Candidatus Marinimicrobia bacterium]|nr:immune inhibitor A [Candidatus Neomarinimicrobiota bacterium]
MNKKIIPFLIFFMVYTYGMAQDTYDKIRVWSENTPRTLFELQEIGVDPEALEIRPGVYVDAIVNQNEKLAIESLGFATENLVLDLSSHYASRLSQGTFRELGYGSMGGYLTFDEIIASMDSLHATYPEIVSAKQSVGMSYEGRNIWAFKISDNPNAPDGDPEVLYNSLTHAREPAAMMTLMHFAWSLAENYNLDPTMTFLVNERELWFIPVVNPDGYVFNQLTHPDGGGMHRKNRRPGCTSSPGVDLNRNWGYFWGYDDLGSSPDSCGTTYRGSQSFSEPETQALRDFVINHDFQTAFNYHSYGNLLVKPFSYNEAVELPVPDGEIYNQLGHDLVEYNDYLFGTGTETVGYTVNGDAVDYMYGDLGIINFTPEVGAGADGGFWPPTDRIFELAADNINMNIHLAGCAGNWIELDNFELITDGPLEFEDVVSCELEVMNKGLGADDSPAILHLTSPDSSIIPSQSSFDVSGLPSQAINDYGSEGLSFEINTQTGELATLILSIEMSGFETQRDTFTWIIGIPDTILFDDFEAGNLLWTSETWGTEASSGSDNHYLTDSPLANYSGSSVSTMILSTPLNLRGYSNPVLRFDASWDIELNYDFCQVLASDDGGNSWLPLSGEYTDTGNGSSVQPLGEPGYHGIQGWIREDISLSHFTGSRELLLSFQLASDNYVEGDGFRLDNLTVLGWGSGFITGDMNRDGLLNVSDAVLLLESIISEAVLDVELAELADTNQDATLDVRDLVILVELILAED